MSSQLQVDTILVDGKLEITAFILPGGTLPENIFVVENSGTSTLGEYYGVASADDLYRMQTWSGVAIPIFGNRFVLHDEAKIKLDSSDTVQATAVINVLKNSVTLLSTELQQASTSSQVINIP